MPSVFNAEGSARQSLREIVTDYGIVALDDERLLTPILTDLLAGQPREATLVRAAARVRVAELLRAHASNRIPVATAIEDVSARLGHEALIEVGAARWIVTEYAVALGQLAPDGTPPVPVAAQGVARVVPAGPTGPPPPTMLDSAPVASDPRPVSVEPAPVAPAARQSDPRLADALPTMLATAAPEAAPPDPAPATRAPVVATILAVLLPIVLGITFMLVVPKAADPEGYVDRVFDQWAMVLLPMTLTLAAVTAAARAGARAWLGTAGYVVGVFLLTAAGPMIGDTDSGMSLLRHLNLYGLWLSVEHGGGSPDLWLLLVSLGLAALAHGVMKRLGLVRRVGLLVYILTPVIVVVANAVSTSGYGYVFESLHGSTSDDVTSGLLQLAVFVNLACVIAILLALVPRIGGRR